MIGADELYYQYRMVTGSNYPGSASSSTFGEQISVENGDSTHCTLWVLGCRQGTPEIKSNFG